MNQPTSLRPKYVQDIINKGKLGERDADIESLLHYIYALEEEAVAAHQARRAPGWSM